MNKVKVGGYHLANNSRAFGDYRINGRTAKIPVQYLVDYVESKDTPVSQVPAQNLCFKGYSSLFSKKYIPSKRTENADTSYPIIAVKGGENPLHLKYRVIDGAHRILKAVRLEGKSHINCRIITNEEFLELIDRFIEEKWTSNEHIELISQKDYWGFPACTYRFKKHDELKSQLLEELVARDSSDENYANRTYVRTKPESRTILDADQDSPLHQVKLAYQEAYNHFYSDVLCMDATLAEGEKKGYMSMNDNPIVSKPVITQSWVVSVPPNPTGEFISYPMTTHSHFMSPACGAYYLNLDNQNPQIDGGNLIFTNPSFNCYDMGSMQYLLKDALRCSGDIHYEMTHELREGDIVIWAGILRHTIQPFRNTPTDRISLITNSCPSPLMDSKRKYNYNISAYIPSDGMTPKGEEYLQCRDY